MQGKQNGSRSIKDKTAVITGENIRIDGGMTRLRIHHREHGQEYHGD